jgi:hypothetical protein
MGLIEATAIQAHPAATAAHDTATKAYGAIIAIDTTQTNIQAVLKLSAVLSDI